MKRRLLLSDSKEVAELMEFIKLDTADESDSASDDDSDDDDGNGLLN